MPDHSNDRISVPEVRQLMSDQRRHRLGVRLLKRLASDDELVAGRRGDHERAFVETNDFDGRPKLWIKPDKQFAKSFFPSLVRTAFRRVLRDFGVNEPILDRWRNRGRGPLSREVLGNRGEQYDGAKKRLEEMETAKRVNDSRKRPLADSSQKLLVGSTGYAEFPVALVQSGEPVRRALVGDSK